MLNFLRSVPELVWAALMVIAAGLGPFAGTLALALHTTGVLGRLFAEASRTRRRARALRCAKPAARARRRVRSTRRCRGVLPQCVAYALYRWEMNIRMAAVLGFVGAGGLGQMLYFELSLFQQAQACDGDHRDVLLRLRGRFAQREGAQGAGAGVRLERPSRRPASRATSLATHQALRGRRRVEACPELARRKQLAGSTGEVIDREFGMQRRVRCDAVGNEDHAKSALICIQRSCLHAGMRVHAAHEQSIDACRAQIALKHGIPERAVELLCVDLFAGTFTQSGGRLGAAAADHATRVTVARPVRHAIAAVRRNECTDVENRDIPLPASGEEMSQPMQQDFPWRVQNLRFQKIELHVNQQECRAHAQTVSRAIASKLSVTSSPSARVPTSVLCAPAMSRVR